MDIYLRRRRGKILLLFIAVIIGIASLMYTNWLTGKMANEERKKVELWAEATKQLTTTETLSDSIPELTRLNTSYLNLLNQIITQNVTIPIIITDAEGNYNSDRNINYNDNNKEKVIKKELTLMKTHAAPIIYEYMPGKKLHLYYRESNLLRNLRYYPFIQLVVIVLFIVVAYFAFQATQKAEQNQVWVGMSKETAHQLGTPISSLMAWIELLKLQGVDEKLISEFEKDTLRLEKITERFSKIGSKPELIKQDLTETLESTVNYLKTRSSNKIQFETNFPEIRFLIPFNASLLSWVVENLCKNAMDAMNNEGKITINLTEKPDFIYVDFTDTGKGVPKSQFKTIFQPGYSTKKRGWGLGLSLAKRIIENYHQGKIYIKWSEINKGTTFRIILNK